MPVVFSDQGGVGDSDINDVKGNHGVHGVHGVQACTNLSGVRPWSAGTTLLASTSRSRSSLLLKAEDNNGDISQTTSLPRANATAETTPRLFDEPCQGGILTVEDTIEPAPAIVCDDDLIPKTLETFPQEDNFQRAATAIANTALAIANEKLARAALRPTDVECARDIMVPKLDIDKVLESDGVCMPISLRIEDDSEDGLSINGAHTPKTNGNRLAGSRMDERAQARSERIASRKKNLQNSSDVLTTEIHRESLVPSAGIGTQTCIGSESNPSLGHCGLSGAYTVRDKASNGFRTEPHAHVMPSFMSKLLPQDHHSNKTVQPPHSYASKVLMRAAASKLSPFWIVESKKQPTAQLESGTTDISSSTLNADTPNAATEVETTTQKDNTDDAVAPPELTRYLLRLDQSNGESTARTSVHTPSIPSTVRPGRMEVESAGQNRLRRHFWERSGYDGYGRTLGTASRNRTARPMTAGRFSKGSSVTPVYRHHLLEGKNTYATNTEQIGRRIADQKRPATATIHRHSKPRPNAKLSVGQDQNEETKEKFGPPISFIHVSKDKNASTARELEGCEREGWNVTGYARDINIVDGSESGSPRSWAVIAAHCGAPVEVVSTVADIVHHVADNAFARSGAMEQQVNKQELFVNEDKKQLESVAVANLVALPTPPLIPPQMEFESTRKQVCGHGDYLTATTATQPINRRSVSTRPKTASFLQSGGRPHTTRDTHEHDKESFGGRCHDEGKDEGFDGLDGDGLAWARGEHGQHLLSLLLHAKRSPTRHPHPPPPEAGTSRRGNPVSIRTVGPVGGKALRKNGGQSRGMSLFPRWETTVAESRVARDRQIRRIQLLHGAENQVLIEHKGACASSCRCASCWRQRSAHACRFEEGRLSTEFAVFGNVLSGEQ